MSAGRVAVVVVTHNSETVIADCLAHLDDGLDGIAEWTLVVVDNASTDATCAVVVQLKPHVHLLRLDHNAGYAAGINRGVAVAGDVSAVLILNPDVLLASRSVAALARVLDLPNTGVVVPTVRHPGGKLHLSLRRDPTVLRMVGEALLGGERAGRFARLGEIVSRPEVYGAPRIVDWASGSVMLIARRCHGDLGGWDESFFLYSEETDFCLRARARGYVVRYTPHAVATHIGGHGERTSLRALMVANRAELFRRRTGPIRGAAFRAALALHEALRLHRGPPYRASVRALLTGQRPLPDGAVVPG